jgi:serine/threonine protein kinase
MIYEMLTGTCPFVPTDTENVDLMFTALMKAELRIPEYISQATSDLLRCLLVKAVRPTQPSQRLTDMAKIQQHPFFSAINWVLLLSGDMESPYHVPAELLGTDDLGVTNRCVSTDEVQLDSLKRYELYFKNYTFLGSEEELTRGMPELIQEEEVECSVVVGD